MSKYQMMNQVSSSTSHSMPYTWQELRAKWEQERISNEQTIGQLVVWGELLYSQLVACQRELDRRARQIEELTTRLVVCEQQQRKP